MEYLRWILLAAGIFFILLIYLLGRKRRQQNNHEAFDLQDDVPEFSAQDWDDLDEGVGKVRIIARDTADDDLDETGFEPGHEDLVTASSEADEAAYEVSTADAGDDVERDSQHKSTASDIIVLYIIARTEQKFAGDKINSAAQASHLVFGEMNIFHRLDDFGQPIYGLANMVEPGSFDPENMHELRTPGLTLFMQISEVAEPAAAFDDMLQCAYRIAEMLDGQLCNRQRQPLTQNDAEQYRELVAGIDA